jgi:hypothetical protein
MEAGQTFEITNFVVDEWRLINTNVKAVKERDALKQNRVSKWLLLLSDDEGHNNSCP